MFNLQDALFFRGFSVSVFGVSAKSMQCSYDDRGNSVPTILLMMQKRLYSGGGLKVCLCLFFELTAKLALMLLFFSY